VHELAVSLFGTSIVWQQIIAYWEGIAGVEFLEKNLLTSNSKMAAIIICY
jgi:hypothetical protein